MALKKISVLSGGEKSRVLLGKMLVRPANLLLLDEPTNHLDMESVDSLVEAVDAFDGAVVLATHSEMILHAMAERLIVFDGNGAWLFEGTYQDFLDRVGWQDEEAGRPGPAGRGKGKSRGRKREELKRMRAGDHHGAIAQPVAPGEGDRADREGDHRARRADAGR